MCKYDEVLNVIIFAQFFTNNWKRLHYLENVKIIKIKRKKANFKGFYAKYGRNIYKIMIPITYFEEEKGKEYERQI